MSALPVTQMVLYKHGVGFFVRSGQLEGESLQLTFRREDINDILKSLAIFDLAGGQVLGLHYQTPMDKAARLASSSINLAEEQSLLDLIRGLRGRWVEVDGDKKLKNLQGRVLGYQEAQAEKDMLLALLTQAEQVQLIPLEDIRALRLLDAQSQADLSYFLDTSMSEEERRSIQVRLSPGQHDLVVQYVAPSPTWRVSYRVVAEANPKRKGKGKLLLQGWALFDNRLEEDLENVQVTLVAGQPISFIYDLYESQIPVRDFVRDTARKTQFDKLADEAGNIINGNQSYYNNHESISSLIEVLSAKYNIYFTLEEKGWFISQFLMVYKIGEIHDGPATTDWVRSFKPSIRRQYDSKGGLSDFKDLGDLFQYKVAAPVTMQRGESGIVPIFEITANYRRELLYNADRHRLHPQFVLRFANSDELTLEQGPATIIEDGDYKGESVLPFTKAGMEVILPYAIELGIDVRQESKRTKHLIGLGIVGNNRVVFEQYNVEQITYSINNRTHKSEKVVLEVPNLSRHELIDTPKPRNTTTTHHYWEVNSPAQKVTTFTYTKRNTFSTDEHIKELKSTTLRELLANHLMNEAMLAVLKSVLVEVEVIELATSAAAPLSKEVESLYRQQQQARDNLKSLSDHPYEQSLRQRMLDKLDQTQTRLEAIQIEEETYDEQIRQARESIIQQLADLAKSQ